jgi:signal transduction histidine kinase
MPADKLKNRKSISGRLIVAIIGFSTFIAIFTSAAQLFVDYRRNMDRGHGDLAYVEVVSLRPLATNLWDLAEENVQQQLDSLVNHPGIDYAAIRVKNKIAWDSGINPKGGIIAAEFPLVYEQRNVRQELGRLRVVAGLNIIYQQLIEKAMIILGTNFLKTLAVGAFMYVLFHIFFTRHLVALADYARNINLKDIGAPLRFQRTIIEGDRLDEFEDIAQAINQMRESLKETYDELDDNKERLRGATDSLQEGFALFDADDRLVAYNDVFRKINPMAQEFLEKGMTFEDVLRANVAKGRMMEGIGREEAFIRERIEQHRNPKSPIIRQRDDGTWFILKEARTPEGGIALTFTDITELKQAEEGRHLAQLEAEQANRAKSKFLATMSHELRTPLNAILGFSDILSHQYFGPIDAKYQEYAEDIGTSGKHLLTLVNDILDLSAIEAGKQALEKEYLSTAEVVEECKGIVEDKARSNGINLATKIPKDVAPLYADKRATMQILLNLLSNAIKFTPGGGKITISAKSTKQNMVLKITDTGKGIPSDILPKLTDPFVRADTDPYLAEQGWGPGLSITKSLVDLHEGSLDIESTTGKGTTISVTLPNGAA